MNTIFRQAYTIGVLLCVSGIFTGCHTDEIDSEKPEKIIALSKIPDQQEYTALSLTGTRWKLIGFANDEKDQVTPAAPAEGDTYTLSFEPNGEFTGKTSSNQIQGDFRAGDSEPSLKIVNFGSTKISETSDGITYVSLLNATEWYEMTAKGLKLFNHSDTYLLYRPFTSK